MSIRRNVLSGVTWSTTGRLGREATQLVAMLIMARALVPAELGVYAIVLVFVNFMNIIGSIGSAQILIMKDSLTTSLVVSLFYLNLLLGAFLFLVLYLSSELIATFFSKPELGLLLKLVGIAFLLQAPILVQRALLEKALEFRKLVAVEFIAVLISSAVGIITALAGYGVYSLLFLNLSNVAVLALCLWFGSDWRPTGRMRLKEILSIAHHAFNLTGSALLNFFSRNADVFLIGRFVGSEQLGFYSLSYRLTLYPVQAFSQAIHRVLFPALSQLRGDGEVLRDAYLKSLEGIALLIFPLTVGLCVIAGTFVPLVLGEQWLPVVPLIYVLAPLGALQAVVATVGTIYSATEQTGLMFRMGIFNSGVVLVAFLAGLPYGVIGVAIAYTTANFLMLYPNLRVCWRLLDLGITRGLGSLLPYFICALFMGLIVALSGTLLESIQVHRVLVLFGQIGVGLLVYPVLVWLFFRDNLFRLLPRLSGS